MMQAGGIGCGGELVAKRAFTEHLGELRQKLQVLFGRVFGHEQDEYLADRLAVGRVKRNRLPRPHKRAQRLGETLDPAVRDRDALSEAGGAEFFAREQAVEHKSARNLRLILEELADLLEEPFLARRVEVEQDIRFGEQLRDLVHESDCGPE